MRIIFYYVAMLAVVSACHLQSYYATDSFSKKCVENSAVLMHFSDNHDRVIYNSLAELLAYDKDDDSRNFNKRFIVSIYTTKEVSAAGVVGSGVNLLYSVRLLLRYSIFDTKFMMKKDNQSSEIPPKLPEDDHSFYDTDTAPLRPFGGTQEPGSAAYEAAYQRMIGDLSKKYRVLHRGEVIVSDNFVSNQLMPHQDNVAESYTLNNLAGQVSMLLFHELIHVFARLERGKRIEG